MKQITFLLLILLFFSCEGGSGAKMQDDFDRYRLNNIEELYNAIQEYKLITGYYPFQEKTEELPVVVIFESDIQKSYHKGKYPIVIDLGTRGDNLKRPSKIQSESQSNFYSLINSSIKSPILYKYDPQKVPTKKPCVYIYTVYKGEFDITAFLHNKFSFTKEYSEFNNRIALSSSSKSFPAYGIWSIDTLKEEPDYLMFKSSPLNKPGYDKKLEEINNTLR